jgi:hypothetical protein
VDCVLQNVPAHNNTIVQMNGSRYYTVSVHCKNITALGKGEGKLGLTNTKQPFLYAWGPTDDSISSASKSASIKRHVAYGNFWMDMTAAISSDTGEVALPTSAALLSSLRMSSYSRSVQSYCVSWRASKRTTSSRPSDCLPRSLELVLGST